MLYYQGKMQNIQHLATAEWKDHLLIRRRIIQPCLEQLLLWVKGFTAPHFQHIYTYRPFYSLANNFSKEHHRGLGGIALLIVTKLGLVCNFACCYFHVLIVTLILSNPLCFGTCTQRKSTPFLQIIGLYCQQILDRHKQSQMLTHL